MKCPHCNQEHPDGTKFCPETGERIVTELNIVCHNENCSNYARNVIPIGSKFCPECGKPTGIGYRSTPYAEARWSTLEEFKKGDVVANHIMLGGAYPYEYLFGEAQTLKEGSTLLIPVSEKSFALMPIHVAYEKGITEKIVIPGTINDDFLSLSEVAVEWMLLDLDENPLFQKIGLNSSNEIANNINILESVGYLRIKNFMKLSTNHTFVASFVSNTQNSIGGHTFIVLFEEYMYVFNDIITEWTSYQEGVVFHSNSENLLSQMIIYEVILKEAGFTRLQTIKAVCESCGHELSVSSYLVDSAPAIIKCTESYSYAERIRMHLENVGAVVEIKRK